MHFTSLGSILVGFKDGTSAFSLLSLPKGRNESIFARFTSKLCIVRISIETPNDSAKYHYLSCILDFNAANTPKLWLYRNQFVNSAAFSCILTSTHVLVEVCEDIITSDQISVVPDTKIDWDIAVTQSSLIEDVFLRQYSVVYCNQQLRIVLSPSLFVNFNVASISSCGVNHEVGKLNELSRVVISPFKEETRSLNRNYWGDILMNVRQFRVLPQRARRIDTNYANSYHDEYSHNSPIDDDLSSLVMTIDEENGSRPYMQISHQDLEQSNQNLDTISAYVNPVDYEDIMSGNDSKARVGLVSSTYHGRRPIVDHVVVTLKESSLIRLGHVSLSRNCRIMLNIPDYYAIKLIVIDVNKLPLRLPLSVDFEPVDYEVENHTNQSQTTDKVTDIEEQNQASILEETRRHIRKENLMNIAPILLRYRFLSNGMRLPLADGHIITLGSMESNQSDCDYRIVLRGSNSVNDNIEDNVVIPNMIMLDDDEVFTALLAKKAFAISQHSFKISITSELYSHYSHEKNKSTGRSSHSMEIAYLTSPHLPPEDIKLLMSSTIDPIIHGLAVNFDPNAVRSRLCHNHLPQTGAVLCGEKGTGKSSIIEALKYLITSSSWAVNVVPIYCADMKSSGTKSVIVKLQDVFEQAIRTAPSIVILDDLDSICHSYSINDNQIYSSEHDSIALISLELERQLNIIKCNNIQSHNIAMSLVETRFSTESDNGLINGSTCNEVKTDDLEQLTYVSDRALSKALENIVFVLGTSTSSTSIFPYLQTISTLSNCYSILPLKPKQRLKALDLYLDRKYHISMPVSFTKQSFVDSSSDDEYSSNETAINRYYQLTEGFVLTDVERMARSVATAYYSLRYDERSTNELGLRLSWTELLSSIKFFAATSRSSSDAFDRKNETYNDRIGFQYLGGLQDAKQSLREVLLYPSIFRRIFESNPIKLSKGILLYGPSGVGKTALANAVSKECGFKFLTVKGPQLLNKYIGASEKAVRDLFEQAKSSGKATILFFDEFEALAPKRGRDSTGVTDRVVNQLLTFLDGVEENMGKRQSALFQDGNEDMDDDPQIYVIAATSRPDLIDVALLRSGRIDHHIYLGLPSSNSERKEILQTIMKNQDILPSKDGQNDIIALELLDAIEIVVQSDHVEHFTSADFKALVDEAYMQAVHDTIHWNSDRLDGELMPCQSNHIVRAKHLLSALYETKSTLSPEDIQYYNSIYMRFRYDSDGNQTFASNSNSDQAHTVDSKVTFK